jgi:hypothetical protein
VISCKVTTHYPPETRLSEIPDLARRKEVASLQLIKSAGALEHDARWMADVVREAEKVQAWSFWGLPDMASLVEKYYGKGLPEVQAIIAGVEELRRRGVSGPIPANRALNAQQLAGTVPEAGNLGDNQHTAGLDNSRNVQPNMGGNSSATRIARLKRDFPEIGARLAAGEFRNVRDAERAAGLPVKPKLTPREKVLRALGRLSRTDQRWVLSQFAP